VPQSFHVNLSKIERGKRQRLDGAQAAHDLLDVMHAHGEMKPVQDRLHRAARGQAHQRRQRGVAVADRGHWIALPPALVLQRRAQPGMGLLGHAAHHGEAPGGVALILDLAADRLEVPNLVTGHGTYVSAIEHDDGPVFIRCCGLVRLVPDSRDLRSCLPVGDLKLQGDGMSAAAQALMVCRRDGQQSFQNAQSSRNEVRAPSSACTRSSSGVQRAVNSAQTGETVRASSWVAEGRPERRRG